MNIMVLKQMLRNRGLHTMINVNYGLSEGAISSWSSTSPNNQPISDDFRNRYNALKSRLEAENPDMANTRSNIVGDYFKYGESSDPECVKKAPN